METVLIRCGQMWQDGGGGTMVVYALADDDDHVAWVGLSSGGRMLRGEQRAREFVKDRRLVYDPAFAQPMRERQQNEAPFVLRSNPESREYRVK